MNPNVLLIIGKYLDLSDLFSFFLVNKEFYELSSHEFIWKGLNYYYNFINEKLILEKKPLEMTFKQYFKLKFESMKTIRFFIKKICKENKDFLDLIPSKFLNIQKKNEIVLMLSEFKTLIPLSYYLFYYFLDSRINNYNQFFGGYFYYSIKFNISCLRKPDLLLFQIPFYRFGVISSQPFFSNIPIFVDFDNRLGFGNESVYSIISKISENSWKCYIYSDNLMNYLSKFINLEYEPSRNFIDLFGTKNNYLSDVTTKGIRIRASAIYNPFDPRPMSENLFAYQLRISANGIQGKFKLKSRRWEIWNGQKIDIVNGDGVVGFYPVIQENCEDFIYESCSTAINFNGWMKGSLKFINLENNNDVIDAEIGQFPLDICKFGKIVEFDMNKKESRILHENTNH